MKCVNLAVTCRAAGFIGFCFIVSFLAGCAKKEAPVSVPQLLPESTLIFDWVPDQAQTLMRFKATPAYELYTHPDSIRLVTLAEEQLLTALKPTFEKYPAVQELYQLLRQSVFDLYEADRGESFFALLEILPATKDAIHLVGGIRPRPEDLPRLKKVVAAFEEYYKKHLAGLPLRKELERFFKAGEGSHKGTAYRWVRLAKGEHEYSFYFAESKGWYLYSVSEAPLKQFLDALAEPNQRPKRSLADREEFRQYVNSAPTLDRIAFTNGEKAIVQVANYFENLWSMGEQKEEKTEHDEMREAFLSSIRSQKNIAEYNGASLALTRIKEEGIEDLSHIRFSSDTAWKATRAVISSRVGLETLDMTRSDTLIYGVLGLDAVEYFKIIKKSYEYDPTLKEGFEQLETQLPQKVNLDLYKNILGPLGPEFCFALDWPESSPYPLPSLWIGLKDYAAFQPTAEQLMKFLRETPSGMYAEKNETQHAEHTLLTYRIPMIVGFAPTLVIGPRGIGFFPDDTAARRYLTGGVPETETLKSAPQFESFVKDIFQKSSYPFGFFYVDNARLAQRTYAALAPTVMMVGGRLFPEKTKEFFRKNPLPREIRFTNKLGESTTLFEVDTERRTIIMNSQSSVGMVIVPLAFGLGAGVVMHTAPYLEEGFLSLADKIYEALFASALTTSASSTKTSENSSPSPASEASASSEGEASVETVSEASDPAPTEALQEESAEEENSKE